MNNDNCPEILYKYRSLENFKWFMDILVNSRLYAATFTEMNDPMEGKYRPDNPDWSPGGEIERIYGKKKQIKICSLTRKGKDERMLSCYADSGRGVLLAVKLKDNRYPAKEIIYDWPPKCDEMSDDDRKAQCILTYKTKELAYEEECRVFTHRNYVDVEIKEIILGPMMPKDDKELIKKIIKRMGLKPEPREWNEVQQ